MRDPYEVLGVSKGADEKAVKTAYRRLARDLHPDLHPGDTSAEDRFKEVAAAYDFLSDGDKKAKYDRGEIEADGTPRMNRTFYRDYAQHDPEGRYGDRASFADFSFFAEMFRNASGGSEERTWTNKGARGQDIHTRLEIDFVEAAKGGTREVVLPAGRRLKVTIPAGSTDGQVLRLQGQGAGGSRGPGDLMIELSVAPHPHFRREGDDIFADLPISLPEAVKGAKVDVPTIDGAVSLSVPKGSNSGTRLRLRGKGIAKAAGGRGDQYVTVQVMLPEKPDPDLERFVDEWPAGSSYPIRGRR